MPVNIIIAPNGSIISAMPPVNRALTIIAEPTTTLPQRPQGEDMNSKTFLADFVIFMLLPIPPGV